MKKTASLAVIAALILQNPVVIFAVENATIKSVRVSAESVYVTTDKPVKHRTFMMEQPPRLVVELDGARLKTLEEIPVNGSVLKRVRTGQFRSSPVSVSRIVMELTQKAVYKVTQKGTELAVVFGERNSPQSVAMKDAPADVAVSEDVKVIAPDSQDKSAVASESVAPVVKPVDAGREFAPVIAPKKASTMRSASGKSIMDSLSKEPISFDYSDADVREVISMMAAKAGINIIYSEDVSGTITINLNKVPFDEAFRTILNVRGLATQQVGDNIIRVASPQTFMKEQKKAFLQTRVFFLNYSKASDIKTQLDAVATAEGRKANCAVDEANNALIVTDSAIGLEDTVRLIRSLDRVPKQVVIEAKLVEVSLDSDFHLGIQWSGYGEKNGTYVGAGNSASKFSMGDSNVQPGVQVPAAASERGISSPFGAASGGTGVNLPANVIYGAFRLGKVASSYMFDAVISAAAKKGKAKVLSDPKVATLNNKEASINITTQIPYTTTETTGSTPPISTTKVTYLTTGIILKVTPTINSDGRISMKINPSVSQPSASVTPVAGGAPGIDTRSADTNVIVRDGETIVIGGLIHDSQSDYTFKVPLLGDIPILGALFRKKTVTRSRMELLIFVTPRILEG